jgi:putative tricarboxylic transport membrane protein
VTAFFVVMLITTALHLVVGRLGMPLFIQAVRIPREVLFPIVLLLCFTGVYVSTNRVFDLYVMLGFGVLGYGMNRFGYPVAPLLIGFILGPLVEIGFRQSMILSRGSYAIFFERPVSAVFLGMAVLTVVWVSVKGLRARQTQKGVTDG